MTIRWRAYLNDPAFRAQVLAFVDYLISRHVWAVQPLRITVYKERALVVFPTGEQELVFGDYPNVWADAQAAKVTTP